MSTEFGGKLSIRTMRPHEVALVVDWAAAEGWNPGLADAQCFAHAADGGFFMGEADGEPVAVVSVANYGDRFAFLGFYIVHPERRGRGYGMRIWQAAMRHAGARTIGLDGVVAQQDNYAMSGFAFAYNNIRYGGVPVDAETVPMTVPLSDVPFAQIVADDASVFPASRPVFWEAWLGAPGHIGRALLRDGKLAAWGVIRPCRRGRKIGPLVADARTDAEAVFSALVGDDPGEVFLDVPQPNAAAAALAEGRGLTPVFETARMYSGRVRPIALERVYGVATFELG